jgi:FkbM family methyltransferase
MTIGDGADDFISMARLPLFLRLYCALFRIFKLNSGLTPTSFNALVNRAFQSLKTNVEVEVGRFPIIANPNDYHGRVLVVHGTNDRKVSRVAAALARNGGIFLDIGANYSSVGFAVLDSVGPQGAVHLFEPQPGIATILRRAIDRAATDNVILHSVALFDRDGEMRMRIPVRHSGMATLMDQSDDWLGGDYVEYAVPTRDTFSYLDPILGNRNFGIKIDVEGAEPTILAGLFKFKSMNYVVFEGCSNEEWLFTNFRANGFVVFGLEKTIFATRLRQIERFEEWKDFHDFVAVRKPAGQLPKRTTPQQLAQLTKR